MNKLPTALNVAFLTLLWGLSHCQPFFTLPAHDSPFCDPTLVSHEVMLDDEQGLTLPPVLLLSGTIGALRPAIQALQQQPNHSAMLLLVPSKLTPDDESTLRGILRSAHIAVLNTSAFTATDPEQHLLADLAIFETPTGIVLPFYTTTTTTTLSFPLFRITIPSTSRIQILRDGEAIAWSTHNKHLQSTSPLVLLTESQSACLFARLQCFRVKVGDPSFTQCHLLATRLASTPPVEFTEAVYRLRNVKTTIPSFAQRKAAAAAVVDAEFDAHDTPYVRGVANGIGNDLRRVFEQVRRPVGGVLLVYVVATALMRNRHSARLGIRLLRARLAHFAKLA